MLNTPEWHEQHFLQLLDSLFIFSSWNKNKWPNSKSVQLLDKATFSWDEESQYLINIDTARLA